MDVKIKTLKLRTKTFGLSLTKLMQLDNVPVDAMFKLRGIVKAVRGEVEEFEEVLKKLLDESSLKKDGKPVIQVLPEGGESVQIDPEKQTDFQERYKKLSAREVKLKCVSVKELGAAVSGLKPEDLYQLDFLTE